MKHITKNNQPGELVKFQRENREQYNRRDWDFFYNNCPASYDSVKDQIFKDQHRLCAYCEELIDETGKQRIEHFHPKSDGTKGTNWCFDWDNMLGVCLGGSQEDIHPKQLHCDAVKGNKIYDGEILNPLDMPKDCLFEIERTTGKLKANSEICKKASVKDNRFGSVEKLVENTIQVLNLNCDTLIKKRMQVIKEFERLRTDLRRKGIAVSAREEIVKRWFSKKAPSFFTTRRILCSKNNQDIVNTKEYIEKWL